MFSFFSRHEVDKQAEGFRQGEDGFPSAGRVAWGLWGGDAGFSWSRRKVAEINRELEKEFEFDEHVEIKEEKAEVSKRVEGILKDKVKDDHNDKVGNVASKRTTLGVLKQCLIVVLELTTQTHHQYDQVLAIQINEALARVNNFLRTLRTGRFRSGAHDTDLLPKGHPKSSKKMIIKTLSNKDITLIKRALRNLLKTQLLNSEALARAGFFDGQP